VETSIFVVVYPEALGEQPIQEHWLCRKAVSVPSWGGDNEIGNRFGNR
jgi:hypothetical protein